MVKTTDLQKQLDELKMIKGKKDISIKNPEYILQLLIQDAVEKFKQPAEAFKEYENKFVSGENNLFGNILEAAI